MLDASPEGGLSGEVSGLDGACARVQPAPDAYVGETGEVLPPEADGVVSVCVLSKPDEEVGWVSLGIVAVIFRDVRLRASWVAGTPFQRETS